LFTQDRRACIHKGRYTKEFAKFVNESVLLWVSRSR
jgi:hypothetical protein